MLDISLTPPAGTNVSAYPMIDVTRADGTPVREIDKTDGGDRTSLLMILSDRALEIGVYLPEGTEGAVNVNAALVATTCRLAGATTTPVNVHGGDRTNVTISLGVTAGRCGSPPGDAGGETGDGASDARPADAATDAGSLIDDCFTYCGLFASRCPSSPEADSQYCVPKCKSAQWQAGSLSDVTGENTFSCRVRHLRAGADMALDCSECVAGSPDSPGVCGPPLADAGERDACPL
ncbi:MAG TPA: hypothetical protein VK989_05865 [Polyangia bacterium]|nr:hypothetical protein [Polyangia bacterium]